MTSLPGIPDHEKHHWSGKEDRPTNANFFANQEEKEAIFNARHRYPKKAKSSLNEVFEIGVGIVKEEKVTRRIMGFGLGFEKIFATTSMKLPVSAYTIFVEFHPLDTEELWSRCFNGLHTVYDLKKWVFEVCGVPMDAYDLSYAEPGKATLTDQLRLLTTQDSLDTRTLAVTRAVHRLYKGIPGVHSIDDTGVTRLYLRLKCRKCGRLLDTLHTCRLYTECKGKVGSQEPKIQAPAPKPETPPPVQDETKPKRAFGAGAARVSEAKDSRRSFGSTKSETESKSAEPEEEEEDDHPEVKKKECLFDDRGYEMFSKARASGGSSEMARIYISTDQEPSKKLKLAKNVLNKHAPIPSKAISY